MGSSSRESARLDRHETYDANFRSWHWRLGAEQLAFSHQQNRIYGGPTDPLYLHNTKATLLFTGYDDVCASLGEDTRDVATKMTNTFGFALSQRYRALARQRASRIHRDRDCAIPQ